VCAANVFKVLTRARGSYGIPLAFRNPYNDRVFKSVNTSLDRHFVFPSPVNVTLFTSFEDFLNKINDPLHPYAFQFSESHVREVLGGVFDLARAVLVNPPNASSAQAFAEAVLSDPLSVTRLNDCMYKCPNPDAYEPYPNPFLRSVADALRTTEFNQSAAALRAVPSGEGLKRHDMRRILGTRKAQQQQAGARLDQQVGAHMAVLRACRARGQ